MQVGLLPGGAPTLPMDRVIAYELELLGSHGMPAHAYPEMLALVTTGRLRPGDLVTGTMTLDEAPGRTVHHGSGNDGRDPPDHALVSASTS